MQTEERKSESWHGVGSLTHQDNLQLVCEHSCPCCGETWRHYAAWCTLKPVTLCPACADVTR